MMQDFDFQIQIRPDALAREGAQLIGMVDMNQLPRYASAVESSDPLNVTLQYGRDHDGVFIDSLVQTQCQILCESCLSKYTFPIHSATRFRPVFTLEAAREINPDDEPVLYEDGIVNIINMLEDDALLALPTYPRCNDCLQDNKDDTFPSQFAIMSSLNLAPEHD